MKKGIIVAGFTALGKTTLGKKYNNVIDLESSLYQWKYENEMTLDQIENNKGKEGRIYNDEFPENYFDAILDAQKEYDVILTSMHWELLEEFEKNGIEYYLAYPELDFADEIRQRCIDRGNSTEWSEKIKQKVFDWYPRLKDYKPKEILFVSKDKYLEDVLKEKRILN